MINGVFIPDCNIDSALRLLAIYKGRTETAKGQLFIAASNRYRAAVKMLELMGVTIPDECLLKPEYKKTPRLTAQPRAHRKIDDFNITLGEEKRNG